MRLGLSLPCCAGDTRRAHAIVVLATAFLASPFASIAQPNSAAELPVLVLVRHADKAAQPADDPPLTAAGAKRAQDLAATLRTAGVTAIITTQLRRTRETAQPLATALGLTPQVLAVGERALVANPAPGAQFPPEVLGERAAYIKALEAAVRRLSGVVLVVGHDWSVPGLIAALGGPQFPNICSSVYDNLFVLISTQGKPNLVQARYGAPTPGTDCN
jgi:broad specificity phosphatase PhoE